MRVSKIILIFLLAGVCFAQKRDGEFAALADRFFDEVVFKYDPVQGTQAGFHQYDAMLGSGSRADIEAQTAALHKFEQEVESFDASGLSPVAAADRELVLAQIRGQLLTLEVIRPWEKNPDIYSSGVSNAVFVIMSRKFRAGGGAAEIGDRARKADAAAVSIGAREPQESAANLHRNCAGTDAGHRQLLPERCARGVQGRDATQRCWRNSSRPTRE